MTQSATLASEPLQTLAALPADAMLTVPQFAALANCSDRHVWRLIDRGVLKPVRLGRLVRLPRAALADMGRKSAAR